MADLTSTWNGCASDRTWTVLIETDMQVYVHFSALDEIRQLQETTIEDTEPAASEDTVEMAS